MKRARIVSSSLVALSLALGACVGDEAQEPGAPSPTANGGSSSGTTSSSSGDVPAPTAPAPTTTAPEGPKAPPPDIVGRSWSPANLKPSLWLRSDSGLHFDAKGVVTGWDDDSGNQNNAAPAPVAGAAPLAIDVATTKAVSFQGAQSLIVADAASMRWTGDFTVVVIAQSSQTAKTYGALYGKTAVAYPYAGPALFTDFPKGATPYTGALGGQIDASNYITSSQAALDDSKPRMFGLERAGSVITVRVNGEAPASHNLVSPIDTSAVGVNAYIGGHPEGGIIQGLKGEIFEVVAVSSAMSDADYATLFDYAKKRYGIN